MKHPIAKEGRSIEPNNPRCPSFSHGMYVISEKDTRTTQKTKAERPWHEVFLNAETRELRNGFVGPPSRQGCIYNVHAEDEKKPPLLRPREKQKRTSTPMPAPRCAANVRSIY